MQFVFFYPKDIQNFFWKIIDFDENLEMMQIAGDERVVFFSSLWRNAHGYWYVIHPLAMMLSSKKHLIKPANSKFSQSQVKVKWNSQSIIICNIMNRSFTNDIKAL